MIYAVDFDGTLCTNEFPEIGKPNKDLIDYLIRERINGNKVILNTMREGDNLKNAIEWCTKLGLVFDCINDNLPELQLSFGNNPRKIYADVYIDDHNARCKLLTNLPYKEN